MKDSQTKQVEVRYKCPRCRHWWREKRDHYCLGGHIKMNDIEWETICPDKQVEQPAKNEPTDYPTYEQCGGGKDWGEMTELERVYYDLSKAKSVIDVQKITIKRLREAAPKGDDVLSKEETYLAELENANQMIEHLSNELGLLKMKNKILPQSAASQAVKLVQQLTELRNDLYDALPTGKIESFDLIKIINTHLKQLDKLIEGSIYKNQTNANRE